MTRVSSSVTVRDLVVRYEDKVAVNGISFQVAPGEIVALLGPNGSGKSSILRALVGAVDYSGEIAFDSDSIALSARERAKRIAFVPQSESYEFDFTAHELATMGRFARSEGLWESDDDLQKVNQALFAVDAAEFQHKSVRKLSGGELQRVWLARALAQDTPIIALDEPTSHLDPSHQRDLATLLRAIQGEGKALVIATHDLNWALALAQRCLVLSKGSIATTDTPENLIQSRRLDEVFGTEFDYARTEAGRVTLTTPTSLS